MDSTRVRAHRPVKRRTSALVAGLAAVGLLITAACSGSVVHTYRTFDSALNRGAGCSELFDQRDRFHNEDTLARIDRDLDRIGCTSPEAARTDR